MITPFEQFLCWSMFVVAFCFAFELNISHFELQIKGNRAPKNTDVQSLAVLTYRVFSYNLKLYLSHKT